MDIEYSLDFRLTKASSVSITKDRDGTITIKPNYLTDDEINQILYTFNKIVTSHKKRHKEFVTE